MTRRIQHGNRSYEEYEVGHSFCLGYAEESIRAAVSALQRGAHKSALLELESTLTELEARNEARDADTARRFGNRGAA